MHGAQDMTSGAARWAESRVIVTVRACQVPVPGWAQELSGQSPKAPKEEPVSGPSWFNFGGSQAPVSHP